MNELTQLYRSLGFEVKVEPYALPEDAPAECDDCYGDPSGEYFVIYTRKINHSVEEDI